MNIMSDFWRSPVTEQVTIKTTIEQQAKAQEPGQLPTLTTLANALDLETEIVACTSSFFTMIVQDRAELGGGYGVQLIALDTLVNKHFDELEQVEKFLSEYAPYEVGSAVWVALPSYRSKVSGVELLKKCEQFHQ